MFKGNSTERFVIVSHTRTTRPFRTVGSAYGTVSSGSYILYLRIFAGVPYFIERNRSRSGAYDVFSGRESLPNGEYRYFGRIGNAVDVIETGSIEIYLPDLRQIYYLRPNPPRFGDPFTRMAS
jgi:hypothetical protein